MLRSLLILGMVILPCVVLGQTPVSPAFEVADVKIDQSSDVRMAVDLLPGGKLSMRNVPMRVMIMFAYHLRADAISGGPNWLGSDRFDVVAKASDTVPPEDLRLMLRGLLAERFKLAVHTGEKVMPAFALVIGKSSPKLQSSEPAATLSAQRCSPGDAPAGHRRVECRHMMMARFTDWLQELAPLDFPIPVVDQTELKGAFDFNLDWIPTVGAAASAGEAAALLDQPGPNIFDAVASQLGLKLESRKLPLPVIVIDRVERVPSQN